VSAAGPSSLDTEGARPPQGGDRATISGGDSPPWKATLLSATDNVAVALAPIAAGERVVVRGPGGTRVVLAIEPIPLCHKIAVVDLSTGEDVRKYGHCIGEAREPITRGAWVHTHNLASRRARSKRGAGGP
jgi:altronate dehydratase small subunit